MFASAFEVRNSGTLEILTCATDVPIEARKADPSKRLLTTPCQRFGSLLSIDIFIPLEYLEATRWQYGRIAANTSKNRELNWVAQTQSEQSRHSLPVPPPRER